MKKASFMKKIIAAVLAGAMVIGCLTGCKAGGGNQGGTTKSDIEIAVWNSGLGTAWIDALIKGFKEVHPEYNVYYNAYADDASVKSAFGYPEQDTVDLYFSTKMYDKMEYIEPLNDLLNETADGDKTALIEKFSDAYLAQETDADGKIHQITYGGGAMGIVYNKALFEQAGITEAPRTTNELAMVCNKLSAKKITPFCHFTSGGYWHFLFDNWYGQYEGVDAYNKFFNEPTKDSMAAKDGRYEILKVAERIITDKYVLSGSNSSDHTVIQTSFLTGKAAMMVNGSWLENEMAASGDAKGFITMKIPVMSAITNKLETVKKESVLRDVIDAVDAVTDGEAEISSYKKGDDYVVNGATVSAADWDYIFKARNTVPENYAGHSVFVPTYSNAKEGAYEFLKYMYSDAGYKIYTETSHITLPMQLSEGEIDTTGWSEFQLGQKALMDSYAQSFSNEYVREKHDLFKFGGATLFAGVGNVEVFCTKNAADRKTADQVWDNIVLNVNEKYEKEWLANIQ